MSKSALLKMCVHKHLQDTEKNQQRITKRTTY